MRALLALALAPLACVDLSLPARPDASAMDASFGAVDGSIDRADASLDAGLDAAFGDAGGRDAELPDVPIEPTARTHLVEVAGPESTSSATFVDVPGAALAFAPSAASEVWIIFVSGRLSSSSSADVGAELRVMIDGAEADLLGPTTTGAADDSAGFMTFDRITGTSEAQPIAIQLRAAEGTATVQDLRILAFLLPPDADPQYFEDDAELERTALAQTLESLPFVPSSAGDYFVFGKASQSKSPGETSVQTWVETSAGDVHPNAPAGVHFSNARASWQPMFTMFRTTFSAAPQAISLVGTSGGDPNEPAWWDEAYVRRANVRVDAGNVAVPSGYPVALALDHASLVPDRALASGDDLRVAHWDGSSWTELDRVAEDDGLWNTSQTTIWFDTVAPIPSNGNDAGYWIYYGNPDAGPPPDDGLAVFSFFDDFSGAALDARWNLNGGSVTIANGRMMLDSGARISANAAYRASGGTIAEVQATLPPGTPDTISFIGISSSTQFSQGGDDFARLYTDGSNFRWQQGTSGTYGEGAVTIDTPTALHRYQIFRPTQNVPLGGPEFQQDGVTFRRDYMTAPNAGALLGFVLRNDSVGDGPSYDWVRVRPKIADEPTVVLGMESAHSGSVASRWRHRKLLAFRADAWDWSGYDASPELSSTNMGLATIESSVQVPDPPGEVEHVILQSERLSASDASTGRRLGILHRGGIEQLATSHRIGADGSPRFGVHHVAALATVFDARAGFTIDDAFASPDGAQVECADAAIVVLRYPQP